MPSAKAEPSPFTYSAGRHPQEVVTHMCKKLPVLAIALVTLSLLTAGMGVASAQDVFKVNYFSNNFAPAPDATVRIDNPGLTYGNLCAMIYVFDADQQLSECCGCVETHNGLRTLSVRSNLTSNPLTGVVSRNGVIKIVSAAVNNSPCDPTSNVTPKSNFEHGHPHSESGERGFVPDHGDGVLGLDAGCHRTCEPAGTVRLHRHPG